MSLPTNFFIGRGGKSIIELSSEIIFTNGNQVGPIGPTNTSLLSYASRQDITDLNFGVTATGIQYLDVPAPGTYYFDIKGASSIRQLYAASGSTAYGEGAKFTGYLTITSGDLGKYLYIAVGQLPSNTGGFVNTYNGSLASSGDCFNGGGGGTFMGIGSSLASAVPIIVAGGGASLRVNYANNQTKLNARENFNNQGNDGGGVSEAQEANTGGVNGNGGNGFNTSDQGTAGGGFYTRGDQNFVNASQWGGPPWYSQSAEGFVQGARGAIANSLGSSTVQPSGGFGGGGAGGWGGSGGGGGYNGGGGGTNNSNYGYGGGGGNYRDSSKVTVVALPAASGNGAGALSLVYTG